MAYQTPPRPGARMPAEMHAEMPPMLAVSNNRSWNFSTPPISPGSVVPPLIPVGYATPPRPGAVAPMGYATPGGPGAVAPMGYATPGGPGAAAPMGFATPGGPAAAQAVYGTPRGPAAAPAVAASAATTASTALMGVSSMHPIASRMGIANPRGNVRRQPAPERISRYVDPEIMETKVLGVYNPNGPSWVVDKNGKIKYMRRASRKSRKTRKARKSSRRNSRH